MIELGLLDNDELEHKYRERLLQSHGENDIDETDALINEIDWGGASNSKQ